MALIKEKQHQICFHEKKKMRQNWIIILRYLWILT